MTSGSELLLGMLLVGAAFWVGMRVAELLLGWLFDGLLDWMLARKIAKMKKQAEEKSDG